MPKRNTYADMIDDLKHYAKYAGMWLTTRGVVTLAVLAATAGLGVGGYYAPLITLPIGLGAATLMHKNRNEYQKTRIKNAYKLELAATLGKDPRAVGIPDLERVAKGDEQAGLPGTPILKEKLDQINAQHRVSLIANIGAVGTALATFGAMIGGGFENILQGWQSLIQPLAENLPISNAQVFAAGTLASGITLSTDYLFNHLGKSLTGVSEPTTFDMIQELKKQQRNGKAIAPEQVLEVFIRQDPHLAANIVREYGSAYSDLPHEEQTLILQSLAQKEQIEAITQKMNAGRISPNELAFIASGQYSGVPERQPTQRHVRLFLPHLFAENNEPDMPAQTIITVTNTPDGQKVDEHTVAGKEEQTANGLSRSFVERYASHTGSEKESLNFVQRILHKQEPVIGGERQV